MIHSLFPALLLSLMIAMPQAARAAEREVRLNSDPGPLVGTLETPDGPQKGVAVLLIAGSGPTDRNGSQPKAGLQADSLRLIAADLAQHGYSSLRADKRCIGDSLLACSGEAKLTIQTYADDAAAWAAFLKAQPGVRCVVLLGHSEGALVAALASSKVKPCGVISVSGMGRPLGDVILAQVRAAGAGDVVVEKVRAILADLEAGREVADVPPALASLFRPAVQPFVRSEMGLDPAAALAAVNAPVLILQGSNDLQVGVEDARKLKAASPNAQLVLLDGVNHILKAAPADRAANIATYRAPSLPLASSVMPSILRFLDTLRQ